MNFWNYPFQSCIEMLSGWNMWTVFSPHPISLLLKLSYCWPLFQAAWYGPLWINWNQSYSLILCNFTIFDLPLYLPCGMIQQTGENMGLPDIFIYFQNLPDTYRYKQLYPDNLQRERLLCCLKGLLYSRQGIYQGQQDIDRYLQILFSFSFRYVKYFPAFQYISRSFLNLRAAPVCKAPLLPQGTGHCTVGRRYLGQQDISSPPPHSINIVMYVL